MFAFRDKEADNNVYRHVPRERRQGDSMRFIRLLVRWFGILSTLALGAAALSPDTFNVPLQWRPWIFLTFIFWFFAFCGGLFNP
jgi:hypothetical protein